MSARATLCLMVKAPQPGRAKTRLIPALGADGASLLARALLRDALAIWGDEEPHLLLATTGSFDEPLATELASWPQISQGQGCLGERLERVLRKGLATSEVAIVHGTDIPGVGRAAYEETMQLLETHDAVLGPADDGGFYWLALRRCPVGLLRGMVWSAPSTCAQTKESLESAGMRVAMLPSRFDVDSPADLSQLGSFLRDHPEAMPCTRSFLASSQNSSLSLIVPTLNEEKQIGRLLAELCAEEAWTEIIVVDGGSSDNTLAIAETFSKVRVLQTTSGRGRQMNAGAAEAVGGTLLFLHADAHLPEGALSQILATVDKGDSEAGAFRLRTRYDEGAHSRPWVRPFLALADMRSRYSKSPYGDQGLFVRAHVFHELGGYPEQSLFEDLHITQALAKRRPLAILPGPMVVSGRRFQERPLYYLALMNTFPLLYRLGVSPRRLAAFYSLTR